jgi:hypothetical protein
MKNKGQNLLVLFNKKIISKREADCLHTLLLFTESTDQFCMANELVDRNRITSNKRKIVKESGRIQLRPFRFLINKN